MVSASKRAGTRGEILIQSEISAENLASNLQRIYTDAIDNWVPVTRARRDLPATKWWTGQFAELRRIMRAKKRRWGQTRHEESRRQFASARTTYLNAVMDAKRQAWNEAIRSANDGDPWNKAYKLLRGKLKENTKVVTLKRPDGTSTKGIEDTIQYLLDSLIPDDNLHEDTAAQREVRERYNEDGGQPSDSELSINEIKNAIKRIKRRRAPGPDGEKAEIVLTALEVLARTFEKVMSAILREGTFPSCWKSGTIKVFLKASDKDPSLVKSYRPITLASCARGTLSRTPLINVNSQNSNA